MRGGSLHVGSFSAGLEADDRYYLRRIKEILEAFPNKGPPQHPAQVCSHVYIGSMRNAEDLEELKRIGITHVVNCAGTRRSDLSRSPYTRRSGVKGYLVIPAEDNDQFDIMKHFPEAITFLDKCRKSGGKALVHCNLGVNRSGAVVAAYLMAYQRMPLLEVMSYLKERRHFILTNRGFRRQLIRFARSKGLLDPVIDTGYSKSSEKEGNRRSRSEDRSDNTEANNATNKNYSTSSLDRTFVNRPLKINTMRRRNNTFSGLGGVHDEISRFSSASASAGDDKDGSASSRGPPPRRSASTGTFVSTPTGKHGFLAHKYDAGKGDSFQLDTVPERKPVTDFTLSRSMYQPDGDVSSSAYQKSVSFRRPTVSGTTEDASKAKSSPSASPKLGFLSRIGTRITRQRSWSNISRIGTSDEDNTDSKPVPEKAEGEKEKQTSEDTTLSTQRPLRVYRRAASDSEVYRRPGSVQTYRRAETIATTDYERERANADLEDDPLLPQEYFYHTRAQSRPRPTITGSISPAGRSSNTINLLARLKPVPRSKTSKFNPLP